ncbi:MAG: nitroreductase [Leptospiraceae bacterium]|nr:nitroreductase [Leptospiraceae bacterium]MCP5495560.1 nitroreductase [Leptospiraceae bacterium]
MNQGIELIFSRKSISALTEPVPNKNDLELILQAATTVPDHNQLKPYRFVIVSGENRDSFAEALVSVAKSKRPHMNEQELKKVSQKAYAAPMQIVIISSLQESKIPYWEQEATVACTGYAIALATHSLGYGAIWKSFGMEGNELNKLFNLKNNEKMFGWINIGTPKTSNSEPRQLVKLEDYVSILKNDKLEQF